MTTVSHTMDPPVLVVERVFDAPRELVFKAYTEPERLARWFGPAGWTLPVCTLDLRPGGVWRYCMRGPNGEESWGRAVYREVVPPERLVYDDAFSNAEGTISENMPQMRVTVEFVAEDGKTRIVNRSEFGSAAEVEKVLAMGVEQGMRETWERLDAFLASES
jgi:uncharacterized protein YndB with AHSA1/START domain